MLYKKIVMGFSDFFCFFSAFCRACAGFGDLFRIADLLWLFGVADSRAGGLPGFCLRFNVSFYRHAEGIEVRRRRRPKKNCSAFAICICLRLSYFANLAWLESRRSRLRAP